MAVSRPIVIGLGELLWDVFPDGRRPGGAPANVAFGANQLGCHGLVATAVGSDADGDALIAFLAEISLDHSLVQRDPQHPTGTVSVMLTAEGHPDFVIHEGVAWDYVRQTPALDGTMRQASAVCFGTLAQRSATSRETIHHCLAHTSAECLRVYDVNLRQHYYHRQWIIDSLARATIVKLNHEEVQVLGPLLDLPRDEVEFARSLIAGWGPRIVCVTRGARGCLAVSADEVHEIPGRAVKVADTVGAGDAFTAGMIFATVSDWPLALAAEFANRIGGLVASRPGAMPDLANEFKQLISQYRPGG